MVYMTRLRLQIAGASRRSRKCYEHHDAENAPHPSPARLVAASGRCPDARSKAHPARHDYARVALIAAALPRSLPRRLPVSDETSRARRPLHPAPIARTPRRRPTRWSRRCTRRATKTAPTCGCASSWPLRRWASRRPRRGTNRKSPDFNPIEQVFAKLKPLLRAAVARTIDALWSTIGHTLQALSPAECANYFANAGHVPANRNL